MKKLFFIVGITALSTLSLHAQEVRLGAKAGVNFASMGGDNTEPYKGLTAYHIGALVEIPLSERIAVQPEVLYSAQGSKFEYNQRIRDADVTTSTKNKLGYINIPIMAKYYIINGLSVEAGPQIGFLVSANSESELKLHGDIDPTIANEIKQKFSSEEQDISDRTKSIDFGVALGTSYRFDMGVFVGARYTLGLSNINDISGYEAKNQNNVFQLSAGYSF